MSQTMMYQSNSDLHKSLREILRQQEDRIKVFISDFDTLRFAQIENPLVPSFLELVREFEDGLARFAEEVEAFSREEDPFIGPFTVLVSDFSKLLGCISISLQSGICVCPPIRATGGSESGATNTLTRQAPLPELLLERILQFNELIKDFGDDLASATGLTLSEREELLKSFEDLIKSFEDLIKSRQEVIRTEAELVFANAQAAINISKSFEDLLKSFEDLANSRQDLRFKKAQQEEELRKSNEDLLKSFEDLIKSYQELLAGPVQKREQLLSEIGTLAADFAKNIKSA